MVAGQESARTTSSTRSQRGLTAALVGATTFRVPWGPAESAPDDRTPGQWTSSACRPLRCNPPSHTQLDSATPGKTQLKPPDFR